jgi:hypothetical protein
MSLRRDYDIAILIDETAYHSAKLTAPPRYTVNYHVHCSSAQHTTAEINKMFETNESKTQCIVNMQRPMKRENLLKA